MAQITITADGLASIIREFDALPAQVLTASRAAINKTTRHLAGQARKELASGLGVAQKVLKRRVATRRADRRNNVGLVWIGLNPLAASRRNFGSSLRQTRKGVKAGKVEMPRAFIATMPTGHEGAYVRRTRKRLPIREVAIPLATRANQAIIAAQAAKVDDYLRNALRHELNYQTNVRGRP